MSEEKKKFLFSITVPLAFILLLWMIQVIQFVLNINLDKFGLLPRHLTGLIGIITAPLLHAGFAHLFSNTLPLLFLGTGILYFYPDSSFKVFLMVYLVPGIFVWLVARTAYHIGASGMVYGLVTFLFFSGIIRRDTRSIALALIVTFLYGSIVWGILPLDNGVSWEYHLFGSLTGIYCAFSYRGADPYKKYDWEDESEEDWPDKLEISHHKGYPYDDN